MLRNRALGSATYKKMTLKLRHEGEKFKTKHDGRRLAIVEIQVSLMEPSIQALNIWFMVLNLQYTVFNISLSHVLYILIFMPRINTVQINNN